ncbi:HAD family hydrolase [Paracoccus sulfuroxidans]|uniref:phosphoglycolate phosphatase n=1 Tax=Paracoccus sulfuroxidans TaxID=384678 RepID=A0A562NFH6_9RHOB|nr:HAD family hydrolase [Paracoccus sulfuroxidans]TWI30955.1 phosphoglycolate phosphatase/pyrophosphatase PpaX [Paracoccus sulfuroxidans]
MSKAPNDSALPQLVIFDLDGTILDSSQAMRDSFERAFRKVVPNAQTIPFHEVQARQGIAFREIVSEMSWPPILAEAFTEENIKNISANQLYPGVKEALEGLSRNGILLGLCTGKDRARTLLLLRELGLSGLFHAIVCGDDPCPGKPAPDGLQKIISETHSDTDFSLFVGDSRVDWLAAANAGMRFLAVRWPDQVTTSIASELCPRIDGSDLVRRLRSGDFSCLISC